jgi:hypothetical protein
VREQRETIVHLLDEVAQHLLGDLEVADDAVLERSNRDDVRGGAAHHPLRLGADGEDLSRLEVLRHHRRLADDDALAAHVDERVRRAEVHADVSREQVE